MQPIPLNDFLLAIDPNGSLEPVKTAEELAALVVAEVVTEARKGSDEDIKTFEEAFAWFDKQGKGEELISMLQTKMERLRNDYMLTQYRALPAAQKAELLSKFPQIKELEEAHAGTAGN